MFICMGFLSAIYLKFVVYPSFVAILTHYKSAIDSNATPDSNSYNSFAYEWEPYGSYEFDEYSSYTGVAWKGFYTPPIVSFS